MSARVLVVETERYGNDDVDTEEPTAADVAEWLASNPAMAVELVQQSKIVGPWLWFNSQREWTRRTLDRQLAASVFVDAPTDIRWDVATNHDDAEDLEQLGPFTKADTIDAAKAAADAALRAAGWSLCP